MDELGVPNPGLTRKNGKRHELRPVPASPEAINLAGVPLVIGSVYLWLSSTLVDTRTRIGFEGQLERLETGHIQSYVCSENAYVPFSKQPTTVLVL